MRAKDQNLPSPDGEYKKSSAELKLQERLEEQTDETQPQLRRSTRQRKPNPKYENAALAEENRVIELSTYEEASQSVEWQKAMEEEILALKENQTWDLVAEVKPISCKWVYNGPGGSIQRYKARLVARGFSQQYGLDYDSIFSPVAKMTTIRVLLALAASKSWKLWQMDVKNAFLHRELDREIYMEQQQGFESQAHPDYVCKLALYGLKRGPYFEFKVDIQWRLQTLAYSLRLEMVSWR